MSHSGIRTGRLTALQKEDGGVRGIVAGDIFRRIVARTIAQQIGKEVEEATSPYQFALSTRAGTECVGHALQAKTALNKRNTILSIDGVGAFDNIRRLAMLRKLLSLPKARAILPFVLLFYGDPSTYFWEDDKGECHFIYQGEGGEQGDVLMSLLYALGQHGALDAVNSQLEPDEDIYGFLDDIYVVCQPERVVDVYGILKTELKRHAGIDIHTGKTKVWNSGSFRPDRVETLGEHAWRGDRDLPTKEQGIKILGCPIGHNDYVLHFLETSCKNNGRS